MDKRIILGITGPIGAGKSTLTRELECEGYFPIYADIVGLRLLWEEDIIRKLVAQYGDGILNDDGNIIRKALGEIAFSTPELTEKLNEIMHSPIQAKINELCTIIDGYDIALEAALLFEWGDNISYGLSVCVDATEEVRHSRTAHIFSYEDFKGRQDSQLSAIEKRKRADIIIENNGTEEELIQKVEPLLDIIEEYKKTGKIKKVIL